MLIDLDSGSGSGSGNRLESGPGNNSESADRSADCRLFLVLVAVDYRLLIADRCSHVSLFYLAPPQLGIYL
jgi:hypothetical protein